MKITIKGRRLEARATHEAKKKTSLLNCVQQTAEWLEMYARILRDVRQPSATH